MSRLYSTDDLAWIARQLKPTPRVLQPLKTIDTRGAITFLVGAIVGLRECGCPWDNIAGRLTDLGLPIRGTTLRSYLRRAPRSRAVPPTPAAVEDTTALDFDIEVTEEPVLDERFDHWFRKP